MNLAAYRLAMREAIVTAVPAARSVELHGGRFDLAELKRISTRAPAIRLAILSVATTEHTSRARLRYDIQWIAVIIAQGTSQTARADQALTLADTLLAQLPRSKLGIPGAEMIGTDSIRASNAYNGAIDRINIASWVIEWRQAFIVTA